MKCKECPAYGKDYKFKLCVLRHNMSRGFCNRKDENIYDELEEFLKTDSRALNGYYELPNYIIKEPTGRMLIGTEEIITYKTTILDGFDDLLKKIYDFYKKNNKAPIVYCNRETFRFIFNYIVIDNNFKDVHINHENDMFYLNYNTEYLDNIQCIINRKCNKMKLGEYAICEE